VVIVLLSGYKSIKNKNMKAKITLFSIVAASLMAVKPVQAQIDIAIGNISAGWDTYNQSAGTITGVYFDVLNNENDPTGSFDIKVYLVDPLDYTVSYAVWTHTDADGQNGNTVVTYDNLDIDFNNTPGIPAGQYRLAVCADPDEHISETDESNNCLFISTSGNNLTYNPSTAGISNIKQENGITIYPNPAKDKINFVQENGWENATINIMDLAGKTRKSMVLNLHLTEVDLSDLSQGLYIYQVLGNDGKVIGTGKIIKE
jgi:hypothetical protein